MLGVMTYTIRLLSQAQHDLQGIYQNLSRRDPHWARQLFNAIAGLEVDPGACVVAPESDDLGQPVRQLVCRLEEGGTYRAVFTIDDGQVVLLRLLGLN